VLKVKAIEKEEQVVLEAICKYCLQSISNIIIRACDEILANLKEHVELANSPQEDEFDLVDPFEIVFVPAEDDGNEINHLHDGCGQGCRDGFPGLCEEISLKL
jgi:hypothetical protein